MSQPPGQWQGYPEQDDPRTVPQVGTRQPRYGQQWQPMQAAQPGQYWQPGYGYPQRRRHPLAWVLTGIGLFMAIVVTLVLVLNSGPDTDSPEGVAEAFAEAIDDEDYEDLLGLACADSREYMEETVEGLDEYANQLALSAEVDDVTMTSDDNAVAEITLTAARASGGMGSSSGTDDENTIDLRLTAEDGGWCIDSID